MYCPLHSPLTPPSLHSHSPNTPHHSYITGMGPDSGADALLAEKKRMTSEA